MMAAWSLPAHAYGLASGFARHAGPVLIASLWESILLAAAAGVCLHLIRRTTARLRFWIWIATFFLLVALPLLNAFAAGHLSATSTLAAPLQLDSRWSYALAALWIAAVLIRSAHLAVQTFEVWLLWKNAAPVSMVGALDRVFAEVPICTSTKLDRPSVIGFFSPRILIPAWLFEQLAPMELRQVVLHELEHLRRGDDWVNLLQKIGLVLFPLNPALFWIDRRLGTERELACDDGVLSRTQAPRAYAACLTTIAERCIDQKRYSRLTVLALGAVGAIRHSDFSRRIEGILGFGGRVTMSSSRAYGFAAFLIAALFGSAGALSHAPQVVSFTAAISPQMTTAQSVPASGSYSQVTAARFQNVVFHPPQPTAGDPPVLRAATRLKARSRRVSTGIEVHGIGVQTIKRVEPRWLLVTSWQQSTPQPVLVTLPDGRTFLATQSADPGITRGDWLLIQL